MTAIDSCTNQQINALLPSASMSPEFAALVIRRHGRQLQAVAGLQVIPIVNKTEFGRMVVPIAPQTEQSEIGKRLHALDRRLLGEQATVGKLKSEKVGLMDDLLTGRVRVTPLLA